MISDINKQCDMVSLTVFNNMGITASVVIELDMSVDQLKRAICSAFEDCDKKLCFNLIHVRTNTFLKEDESIKDSQLCNADEILIVNQRKDVSSNHVTRKKKNVPGPGKEEIYEATSTIPVLNPEHSGDPQITIDLKANRGLFIILIDLADKLLCLNEDIMRIYKEAELCFEEHARVKEEASKYDQKALVQLLGMGFSEKRAKQALEQNDNNLTNATQWLLENEHQESAVSKDDKTELSEKKDTNASSNSNSDKLISSSSNEIKPFEISRLKGVEKVKRMVRAFRAAQSKGFDHNKEVLLRLMDMGFEEEDAAEALRLHDNNEQAACDYLLSEDTMKLSELDISEDDWTENSELYDKLRDSPHVQSTLNKPKSLIALLSILEHSGRVSQWNADKDIGLLFESVVKILKKYQCEKHTAASSTEQSNMLSEDTKL